MSTDKQKGVIHIICDGCGDDMEVDKDYSIKQTIINHDWAWDFTDEDGYRHWCPDCKGTKK